jgi:hypothetical protein
MPTTRTSERRLANKRTILSALDENSSLDPTFQKDFHANGRPPHSSPSSCFPVPDLDYTQLKNIQLLLADLEHEIDSRKESLDIQKVNMLKRQQEVYFVNMVKIAKSIKKMTIREFNSTHNTNIVEIMKNSMIGDTISAAAMGAKKRVRSNGKSHNAHNSSRLPMETPVRQIASSSGGIRTPGTILRTVRKGETVYSINGSPVDMAEEGDLVATVCKKRRGNGSDGPGAIFDINVGDGRYINLSDTNAIRDLPDEMKTEAKNQLNVLQDQLSKLMAHLKN